MYLVRWNDHEGNLKERPFGSSKKALLAAESLREDYDSVEVVRAGGGKAEGEQAEGNVEPSPVRRSVVEGMTPDDPVPGTLTVTIGRKEVSSISE